MCEPLCNQTTRWNLKRDEEFAERVEQRAREEAIKGIEVMAVLGRRKRVWYRRGKLPEEFRDG